MFKFQLENHPVRTSLMLAIINSILFYVQKSYAYNSTSFAMNIATLVFGFCTLGFSIGCMMFIFGDDPNSPALIICNTLVVFAWIAVVIGIIGWNSIFPLVIPIIAIIIGIALIIVRPGQKLIWSIIGFVIAFFGLMQAF